MYCHKCGKENHENSKFCHSCGVSLKEEFFIYSEKKNIAKNFKIKWRSPIVLIIISLIIISGLVYGGINTYAYYQVESNISKAEKLQISKDYTSSLNILNELDLDSSTDNQKIKINKLKEDNKKFSEHKTIFDTNVLKINSSSSVDDLKLAQTNLQSIDSTYPDYENVRNKLSELNTLLLVALENDSAASKALAEKNKKDAASAQAAKDKAEQNAQIQINIAKGEEVKKAFINELTNAYNSYVNGSTNYSQTVEYSNDSESLLALSRAGTTRALLNTAYDAVSDLNSRYTNMPSTYYSATNDLLSAIDNLNNATDLLVKSEGNSLDYSSSINTYKNNAYYYSSKVKSFIDNNRY